MEQNSNNENDLRRNGLKSTKSRLAIIDVLQQSIQPISADKIFQKLNEEDISINLSTVYRTLDSLAEKKLVTKINILDDERMLFEYSNIGHRHYLVCIGCKKIVTLPKCPLKEYEKVLEDETNFKIAGHKLYLYGYCMECQKEL